MLRPHSDGVALLSEQMQNVCTQFPYQGSWSPDGVALTSGRVQAIFSLRVCKGKLESSRTLKSVQTCCHDVWTAFGWCCPIIRMDAECMHTISLSRISEFKRCCPDVRMGASCLPTQCLRRKAGIFLNSEEHPDVLP
jgi:hypothetical protein